MSEYHQCAIELKDEECIVKALEEMGYKPEIHTKAKNLHGYQNDVRKQKAHIIIPKSQISTASNDIGFEKSESGYTMHVSEYDENCKFFKTNKLKQLYAKHKLNKAVKKKAGKYRFNKQKVTKDGSIKITLTRL